MNKMLLDLPTRFETGRLLLRHYQVGDGPLYFSAGQVNRQHLQRYEADNAILTPTSESEAEALVRSLAADWVSRNCFFLGAFDKVSGEFVAQVYIGPVSWETPEFEIGFMVDQAHEGRGFVTEAVKATLDFIIKHLEAQRVSLRCDETNLRSQWVAERCGFRCEGHLRQDKRQPGGSLSGTLIYGLLREEWARQPA